MADNAPKKSARTTKPGTQNDQPDDGAGTDLLECFVMMPISDPDGYAPGHFQRVYEDIIRPACQMAGYRATRADYVQETNLIHLDILQRLLSAPVAVCDLSTRNANVLFELGLRQAFDKPVVLIREVGTPDLFDVAPLRATPYRPSRLYHEVLEDQEHIRDSILATIRAAERNEGVNSLVRLLSLSKPASLQEMQQAEADPAWQLIRSEITELRTEIRRLIHPEPVAQFVRQAPRVLKDPLASIRIRMKEYFPDLSIGASGGDVDGVAVLLRGSNANYNSFASSLAVALPIHSKSVVLTGSASEDRDKIGTWSIGFDLLKGTSFEMVKSRLEDLARSADCRIIDVFAFSREVVGNG